MYVRMYLLAYTFMYERILVSRHSIIQEAPTEFQELNEFEIMLYVVVTTCSCCCKRMTKMMLDCKYVCMYIHTTKRRYIDTDVCTYVHKIKKIQQQYE